MTYQPPEQNPQSTGQAHPQQQGEAGYSQDLWPDYAREPEQVRPVPVPERPAGSGVMGVLALVLGLVALVVPFLPMDMSGFRQYAALPFAVPGIGLAIAGLSGRRRGKPLAVVGAVLCAIALVLGRIMLANY
ncbi:hypothetical protein [Kribbella kalugense]|uniref:Uncharacterized protein n=1 Tax=Kribbella kalugense TaxID=2512221 RepID=A0A4R7ZYE9_9ACTN|nr:hypothetical protein [Kribbella kalugense]TDW22845.1 hypothetical protein EV650_1691 [Kribbella kalugense]